MITTQISGGIGNMVVKTKDPLKGWSDPIRLNFGGIDPSLFFDDDGKVYVVHNDAPRNGEELYPGHRVIKIWEYDLEKDQVITGTDNVIVNGGVDISQKPDWIEGPHLYKRNGRYYLMCAEGGTGGNHSEVIFISDNPKGPYKSAEKNPILTQRHLPKNRLFRVDWAGHADLVEGPGGKYYGVFLAVRPNEKNRVNTGRETFVLPVDWTGEFPVFEGGLAPLKAKVKMPAKITYMAGKNGFFPSGNFTFTDDFKSAQLDHSWIGVRGPYDDFIKLRGTGLEIIPMAVNIKEASHTSAIFHRQQHLNFSATVNMSYVAENEKDLAGIVCMQNEKFHYVFGVTKKGNDNYLVLQRTEDGISKILASEKIRKGVLLRLQAEAKGDVYHFNYSQGNEPFKNLGGAVSGDILSTDIAKGFTGNLIGLYATYKNDIVL